ncbi:unnamed protein product [Boreogadus saida]
MRTDWRYNPPHRTDQTHLQALSNHVDCYKAAGMKADVASGPDRRTEYNPPHRTDQTHLQALSNHVDCYKAAGMKADVASGPDRRTEWGRCRSRVGATWNSFHDAVALVRESPIAELNTISYNCGLKAITVREYQFLREYCTVSRTPWLKGVDIGRQDTVGRGPTRHSDVALPVHSEVALPVTQGVALPVTQTWPYPSLRRGPTRHSDVALPVTQDVALPVTQTWPYPSFRRGPTRHSDVALPVTQDVALPGEDNCFYGTLLPTLETLISKTMDLKSGLQILGDLPEAVVKAIKTRFAEVLERESAVLAAVTLPRFKLRWLRTQERKDNAKASLLAECPR